jgi:hypothetical protein
MMIKLCVVVVVLMLIASVTTNGPSSSERLQAMSPMDQQQWIYAMMLPTVARKRTQLARELL